MEQWPLLPGKEEIVTPKSNGIEASEKSLRYMSSSRTIPTPTTETIPAQATGSVAQRKLDLPTEGEKPKWENLFNGNRLSARGMSISYVAPTMKNGGKMVELNKDEVEKAIEEWKHALILYVVGDSPTIAAVERYITLYVNTASKPKIYDHNDGYFVARMIGMNRSTLGHI